ncbi:hypothetical protein M0R45_007780 [Rubus argutus]|uniref:Uncharacterized protein n=1 Tax=Rubus argutus TaxID=59490 RepID=A0AAW1XYT3_RUBAR
MALSLSLTIVWLHPVISRKSNQLTTLSLASNQLTGSIPSSLGNLTQLTELDLSDNNSLSEFPSFLRYQENLRWLDLAENRMHGQVPRWMLERQVLPLICNLTSLKYLDMSNNKLSGMLPQCLGNFSESLRVLDLGNNSFEGHLPQTYTSNLTMIDATSHLNILSGNAIQGTSSNQFTYMKTTSNVVYDPSYRGGYFSFTMTSKGVERFYPKIREDFAVIDISSNKFEGKLPEFIWKPDGASPRSCFQ